MDIAYRDLNGYLHRDYSDGHSFIIKDDILSSDIAPYYTTTSASYLMENEIDKLKEEIEFLKNSKKEYNLIKCPCCGASSIKNNRCEYCGSYFM